MRLYQGPDEREGYVLVCINKRWGPMCRNYRQANLKTICTQLGYMDGGFLINNCIHIITLNDSLTGNYVYKASVMSIPVQRLVLYCNGDESRIFDCAHDFTSSSTCRRKLSTRCKPGIYTYELFHIAIYRS